MKNAFGIDPNTPHPMFPKISMTDLKEYLIAYYKHKEEIIKIDLEKNPHCASCGIKVQIPKLVLLENKKTGEHKGFLCLACAGPKYDQSGFPINSNNKLGETQCVGWKRQDLAPCWEESNARKRLEGEG